MAVEVILTIASVGSWMMGSGTLSTRTSSLPCQTTAFKAPSPAGQYLAYAERPAGLRRERRRVEARPGSEALQKIQQRFVGAALRLPAQLPPRAARVHYGYAQCHVQPALGDGLDPELPRKPGRRAAHLRRDRHGAGVQYPPYLLCVHNRFGRQVERAPHLIDDGEPESLAHVVGVDDLGPQIRYVGDDVYELRANQGARQERSGEEAPYPLGGLFLEDEAGAHPDDPDFRRLQLEAVQPALDLGLVASVVGGRRAARRPTLVHAPVLGARRVRADRRGVEERRHPGLLCRPRSPHAPFDVHHPLLVEVAG